MRGLKNRVAIVTGASSGIGRATTARLVEEGARVVLADIQEPACYAKSDFVRTDVTNKAEVDRLILHAFDRYGRIDVLVNNAGIALPKSILDTTEDDWNRVIDVNMKGVYLCAQAAVRQMLKQRSGIIVNVASELGTVAARNCAAYCATKGGVIQITKALAVDHAADGIRANCLCPGPVESPLLDVFLEATGNRTEAFDVTANDTLLGRMGKPEEMASIIAFLASDDASYMTGAVVIADGGLTAR